MFYLREDVISANRKPYAIKGEKIKVISDHDNCVIAESLETLKRFGVNKDILSKESVPKDLIIETKKSKNDNFCR
jgi:hypothetical protein